MAASDYQNVLTRGTLPSFTSGSNGTAALLADDVASEIVDGVVEQSAALRLFEHQVMPTQLHRMPVFATLPSAYWITGDTGLVKTSKVSWKNKFLQAEDMGVIIPIPKKLLSDTNYDVWKAIKPRVIEAIALKLDGAVLFGLDRPASWPMSVAEAAIAVGNTVVQGVSTIDILDDINNVMAKVEESGNECTSFFYRMLLQKSLRGLRDSQKRPLFEMDAQFLSPSGNTHKVQSIWGLPATTSKLGAFEAQTGTQEVRLITGDFSQGIIGIRHDIEFEMFKEGVILDDAGGVAFNLMQQQMVALMVTVRYAWQVANPINRLNTVEAETPTTGDRYPFAVLLEP